MFERALPEAEFNHILSTVASMSPEQLSLLAEQAQQEIESVQAQQLDAVREQIERLAASTGRSVAEIMGQANGHGKNGKRNGTIQKTVGVPKYRHPESGAVWTGRGKAPFWVKELEAQGRSRQEFAI